eukprot:GHUV01019986.1.p1 GENE.GHUV01019986.1~~GHUV01019986.1.p1  ORF type:complete len:316 (+),score=157.86 GHUV01019986.1:692-1639(+)
MDTHAWHCLCWLLLQVQEMYAAALAEDPNAFNYDEVYDSIQEQKALPKLQDRIDRKPKYIASLLEQAQVRKREEDITYERRLLKDRQKEDHMFDNEEKFITSAYRKKLEEDKKWIENQKLKDMEDERNDVTKLGHMNNFFTNLTKNVALGGSAAPAKQQQQQALDDVGPDSPAAAARGHRKEDVQQQYVQQQQQQQQQQRESSPVAEPQQQQQQRQKNSSRDDRQDHGESPGQHQRHHKQQQPSTAQSDISHRQQHSMETAAGSRHDAEANMRPAAVAADAEQQQPAGAKRKNDDAAVAAARERYLARKRQQLGA